MTIQVELSPETEAQLTFAARAYGVPREKYAGSLLRDALASSVRPTGKLTVDELHTMLREMAQGSESLPVLPASASSRESFYEQIWTGEASKNLDPKANAKKRQKNLTKAVQQLMKKYPPTVVGGLP